MTAALLPFPSKGEPHKKASSLRGPDKPVETFTLEQSRSLNDLANEIHEGGKTLLAFIHSNRLTARKVGIETIAIELAAIMEGDRFRRFRDALDSSVREGQPAKLTSEGLSMLRTFETLLAEAAHNLRNFSEGEAVMKEIKPDHSIPDKNSAADSRHENLGARHLSQETTDTSSTLTPLIIFGAATIVAMIIVAVRD